MARPWEKSITSSSVPWITSTGDVTFETLSMLPGKQQKIQGHFMVIFVVRQLSRSYKNTLTKFSLQYLGKASKHQVR
jgi:hypothetical protein